MPELWQILVGWLIAIPFWKGVECYARQFKERWKNERNTSRRSHAA